MPRPAGRHENDEPVLMSLREAAALSGAPRAYLDECIAAGRLAVHLRHTSKGVKLRVTRIGLVAAGILPPPVKDESLVQLLREQAERLAAVEEQRFQLAGQLGAALERNRALEERLQLAAVVAEPPPMDAATSPEPASTSAPAAEAPSSSDGTTQRIDGLKPAPERSSKQTAAATLRGVIQFGRRAARR